MGKKWGRTKQIYEDHFEEMARQYEGGAEMEDIAERYDVSTSTVYRWLLDAGYKHRGKGRYPKAMKKRAAELAARGWSYKAIANLLDVERPCVDEWVKGFTGEAIKPNPGRKRKKPKEPEISKEAQELIDNPPWTRHKRGRRWTDEQKRNVLELMERGFTPLEVWRIAGASKQRQRMVWREFGGVGPPPNLKKKRKKKKREERIRELREERKRRPEIEEQAPRGPRKRIVAPGGRREMPELGPKPPPRKKPLPPEGRPEPYEPLDVELPPERPKRRRKISSKRKRVLPEGE